MIVTVTPNPSVDRTVSTPQLHIGQVNRITASRVDPGGKGVNVARALHRNGYPCLALLPLAGATGVTLHELLALEAVPMATVLCQGDTRTNLTIVDTDGTTTKINEPGPALDHASLASLLETVPADTSWIAWCGSLAPGIDPRWLTEVIAASPQQVAVDTSGDALKAAVLAGPALIKPNRSELAELVGRSLPTLGAVIQASTDIIAAGVGAVVTSLGRDGAVWVDRDGVWFATATVTAPRSTVGAGDCLLAGILAALNEGATAETALARGVAWGAAAVALPGSAVPSLADIDAVKVRCQPDPDPRLPLTD